VIIIGYELFQENKNVTINAVKDKEDIKRGKIQCQQSSREIYFS